MTEPALKAFALRLADTALDDRAWVESVANLLARKSPERWLDNDETEFHHQLEIAAARFKRTEMTFIGTTRKLNGHACRIAITKSDGSEVGDLVDWNGMDESRIRPVETRNPADPLQARAPRPCRCHARDLDSTQRGGEIQEALIHDDSNSSSRQ